MNGDELERLQRQPETRYRPKRKDRICRTKGRPKKKYKTRAEADLAILKLWSSVKDVKIDDLHSYPCPECGWFHVGHVPR